MMTLFLSNPKRRVENLKIRKKTMIITSLFIIITFTIIIGLTHTFLMSRFKEIESENTLKNMQQIQEAFQS